MPVAEALMTVEEYESMPDNGEMNELVRGRIVSVNMPKPRHGQICVATVRIVGGFIDKEELGHVVCNDTGVITERDPDTIWGVDFAFYSYLKVPKGPLPQKYLRVAPDLVIEVRSPGDRWTAILEKVVEYLKAGVTLVCVLDQMSETARVYSSEQPERIVKAHEELELPEVLPGFKGLVQQFFE